MLLGFLSGCGSDYTVVPASGRITLNGEPLANATITTQPVGTNEDSTPGPGSFARTDEDGRFTLELQLEKSIPGAVIAEHRITIIKQGHAADPSSDVATRIEAPLPEDYRNGTVRFTVPEGGTDQMNFEIDTRRRRR